jgi:uncharacterized membrane protein
MKTNRLEAFTDGVIAILITIMVLELKVPQVPNFDGLLPLWPVFLSYILSFVYLGIYWNNHHHMFHLVETVSGRILWWNNILLFILSLVPFTTAWMGENHFSSAPVGLYGLNLLAASLAYWVLQNSIIKMQGPHSLLKKAVGNDKKGKISPLLYAVGILFSFFFPLVSCLLYAAVALIWVIPDRRIENVDC